jgi:hypothetical protein
MTLFDTFGDSRATIATAHKERTRCPTLTSSMLPKLHSGALAYERLLRALLAEFWVGNAAHNGHLGDALKIDANDPGCVKTRRFI